MIQIKWSLSHSRHFHRHHASYEHNNTVSIVWCYAHKHKPFIQFHSMQKFLGIIRHIAGRCNIFCYIKLCWPMNVVSILQRISVFVCVCGTIEERKKRALNTFSRSRSSLLIPHYSDHMAGRLAARQITKSCPTNKNGQNQTKTLQGR